MVMELQLRPTVHTHTHTHTHSRAGRTSLGPAANLGPQPHETHLDLVVSAGPEVDQLPVPPPNPPLKSNGPPVVHDQDRHIYCLQSPNSSRADAGEDEDDNDTRNRHRPRGKE